LGPASKEQHLKLKLKVAMASLKRNVYIDWNRVQNSAWTSPEHISGCRTHWLPYGVNLIASKPPLYKAGFICAVWKNSPNFFAPSSPILRTHTKVTTATFTTFTRNGI